MSRHFKHLELPDAPETIAFRAIEAILATDATLKRVVRDFNAWTGEPMDLLPATFATCPSLTIAPAPLGSDWEAEGLHKMPMAISILCTVAGSHRDNLMNFWGAIRRALWPEDPARFAVVRKLVLDAHITRPTLTASAYGVTVDKEGIPMLVAEGTLKLILHIDTP